MPLFLKSKDSNPKYLNSMKTNRFLALTLVLLLALSPLFAQSLPEGYPQTERQKTCINASWLFHLGDPDGKYFDAPFDDSDWEAVNLPPSGKSFPIHPASPLTVTMMANTHAYSHLTWEYLLPMVPVVR